jgi:hypothetical protein
MFFRHAFFLNGATIRLQAVADSSGSTIFSKFLFIFSFVLTAILVGGCTPLWQTVQGPVETPDCSIQMPHGWMRMSTNNYEMFSKDGPYLQYIILQEMPLNQGFQYTRRKLNSFMLPNEIAEVIVDNLKADPEILRFKVISNAPTNFCGFEGFVVVFTYQDRQGVDMKTIYYGVVINSKFISLRYNAAQRHYFEAELPAFQSALDSLRCSPPH